MVKEIAFFAYSVSDLPRAKAFYQDVLGLKPDGIVSDHWVEFGVGNTTFGIGDGTPLGYIPGESTGAAFEVDDIHAMRQRLIDAGVDVSDVRDFPPCFSAFAKDPEGNRFAIHQRK
jgi:predicted enzyme related to lactoylglutathione lyase